MKIHTTTYLPNVIAFVVVLVLLPVHGALGHGLPKCGGDFDPSAALRKRGLDPSGMVPKTKNWTDKYITEIKFTPKVFCDGSGAGTEPGFFDPDEWGPQETGNLGCCLYDYPANEYSYCSDLNPVATFCDGPLPNRTLFANMGERGQDCDSWFYLTELMEKTVKPRQIANECERRNPRLPPDDVVIEDGSVRKRMRDRTAQFNRLADVVPPPQKSWTDKYIVEENTREMLYCAEENTANLVGYWALDSDEANWWKEADEDSDLKSSCSITPYPNNMYEYCDEQARTLAICDGSSVNKTFLDEYGFFGQDCESWGLLTSYLSEELTLDDLEAECSGARRLNTPGCQEDSSVGLPKGTYGLGGYDYFAIRFKTTSTSRNKHFHIHFWNSDSIVDESFNDWFSPLSSHPGFQSCYQNYRWGTTWNRPQVCPKDTDPFWWADFRAAFASPAQPPSEQHGGERFPVMNLAMAMPGTVEVNYAGRPSSPWGTQCPNQPKADTSGYTLNPTGSWCLFQTMADSWSSTSTRMSQDRNICSCNMADSNFNNDNSACRSIPCPQYTPC